MSLLPSHLILFLCYMFQVTFTYEWYVTKNVLLFVLLSNHSIQKLKHI